jgi:hypothetical protein
MKAMNILRGIALINLVLATSLGTFAQKSKAPTTITEVATEEKLPAGTTVVMETINELSSGNMSAGQSVPLRVKYDVIVKGKVLIKGGAMASGQITSVEQRGGMGKKGSFNMRPTVAQSIDGQMIVLTNGGASMAGEGKTGSSVALAAVVSPLFLLKKGKDAVIPPGYELQGTVANQAEIALNNE